MILAATVASAAAQRVIDGDTIEIDGIRWRLRGIDAPETHQTCAAGWPAGIEATAAMRKLIEGKAITCELRGTTATSARLDSVVPTARI